MHENDVVWQMFSDAFDELDAPMKIIVQIDELRSLFWKKYHCNRNKFQKLLRELHDDPEYTRKINLYGGPGYRYGNRPNWVEMSNGKRFYLIEIRTEKHEQYMAAHRT